MPYAAHPTNQVQQIKNLYLTAKARVDANKNILKAGPLKKTLDDMGKQMADQLATDIAGIRHNAVEHFQKVDAWLGNAVQAVKRAEEARARWEQEHLDHDAEIVLNAEPLCGNISRAAEQDALEFGASWSGYREFNCGEVDKKYSVKYSAARLQLMEESKGVVNKIARIGSLHHEALTLRNLQLSAQHINDRNILGKQGAALELFRSIEQIYTINFTRSRDMGNAAQNCETINGWLHNPLLKSVGDLRQLDSIFTNLANLRKAYIQGLTSMQKTYDTGIRQFQGEDLHDQVIRQEVEKSRALVADTRQKFQFVENGYKNAMSDMAQIRGILKK